MEDEVDIARRAVGQVMWQYFHIIKRWTAAGSGVPLSIGLAAA
jgi:hypothetical protein